MRSYRMRGIAALAASALLTLTACSTDETAGDTPKGNGSLSDATVAALQKKLDQSRAVPAFPAPGPPIDVTSLKGKGKKIYIIPETNNVFNNVNVGQMKALATKA